MAIEIKFLANLVSFIRGTRDMGDHLEDVADAISDVVEEADKAERAAGDIGDATAKGAREADTALDRLRGGFRQVGDQSRKTARDSKDDFRDMGDNVKEFRQEAVQNLSETASSFKGDIQDMADGVQGLTGGLAASLTPGIGIPVAILGAAAAAWLASWTAASEESTERVSTMFQDMLEAGNKFRTDEQISQAITDLADDTDKWNQALAIQRDTGLSIQTVLRAMVGDQDALAAGVAAEQAAHEAKLAALQNGSLAAEDQAAAILLENQRHQDTLGLLQRVQADTDTAAAKAAAVAAAFGTGNAALDLQISKVQTIAAQLRGLSDQPVTVKINADTTGVDGAFRNLQGRTVTVNVNGQITRIGNQVW